MLSVGCLGNANLHRKVAKAIQFAKFGKKFSLLKICAIRHITSAQYMYTYFI